jgi:hypothetical protein
MTPYGVVEAELFLFMKDGFEPEKGGLLIFLYTYNIVSLEQRAKVILHSSILMQITCVI